MTEVEHPIVPEDVMALWEGQLSPDHAALVSAHVSGCATCQRIAHELGGVSHDMALWRVEEVPDTLRTPELRSLGRRAPSESPARRFWLPPVWQLAGSAVAVALVIVVVTFGGRAKAPTLSAGAGEAFILSGVEAPELSKGERVEEPSQTPRALGGQGQGQGQGQERQAASAAAPIRAALITRTAAMRIVASDFDAVRPAIDRVLADTGGFVGQIDASGDRGGPRSFRASVRIPAARLDAALAAFKGLGEVIAESQGADDVSEQVVDLDARLSNARNTERRLTELLRTRTGTVAGVLEVEREIARVRDVIERTEADRTNLGRRIEYATLTLDVVEARKAALDLGPLSLSARLRNAFVDGTTNALESVVRATLFAIRFGPVMLLWVALALWPAFVFTRRYRMARPAERGR